MFIFLVAILCLHVVTTIFWAGSTFTLARKGGVGAESVFRPQMGAATAAFLTGAILWHFWHRSSYDAPEVSLTIGVGAAVVAAGLQGALRQNPVVAQRGAALLLMVAAVAMTASRFVA